MNGPRYMKSLESAYMRIFSYWQDKQRVLAAAKTRRPVLALSEEALPLLARAFWQNAAEFSIEQAAKILDTNGVRLLSLGSEKGLNLALPFDVATHFYIFLTESYAPVQQALLASGLKEHDQFYDGHCLLGGHPWISELRFGGEM